MNERLLKFIEKEVNKLCASGSGFGELAIIIKVEAHKPVRLEIKDTNTYKMSEI